MPPPTLPTALFSSSQPNDNRQEPRPPSPAAPPYSPITPTMSASFPVASGASSSNSTVYNSNNNRNPYPYAPPPLISSLASSPDPLQHSHPPYPRLQPPLQSPQLKPQLQHHSQQQPHQPSYQQPQQPSYPISKHMQSIPPSQPISESDNPDAIALRAAMSILQIQRQQALKDLKTLEQQKGAALNDPEGFTAAVKDGRIRSREVRGVGPYEEEEDEEEDGDEEEGEGDEAEGARDKESRMEIPGSQNVVRAPPINWAQYHVVGESLDKLHEEQRRRPVGGEPIGEEELRPKERVRAPEHVIAKPYDPFVDKLGTGVGGRTRKETGGGAKKRG